MGEKLRYLVEIGSNDVKIYSKTMRIMGEVGSTLGGLEDRITHPLRVVPIKLKTQIYGFNFQSPPDLTSQFLDSPQKSNDCYNLNEFEYLRVKTTQLVVHDASQTKH